MTDFPLATSLPGTANQTITLFGDNDEIDHALSAELGRRGCRTHAVSVETGWLSSAANVICRLDTAAGQRAMEGLVGRDRPRATVIAVCERPTSAYESRRIHDMCQECGRHHDVSLIWHSAVDEATSSPLEHLAVSVADEVSERMTDDDAEGSFTSRFVDLG